MARSIRTGGAYTRGSVERALELHFPGRWQRSGNGYTLDTAIGVARLHSLREAYLMVVAAAEAKRIERKLEEVSA
jgi:hypothetical protein